MTETRFPVREQRWWHRRWVRWTAIAVAVVLVAAAVVFRVVREQGRCADGVTRVAGDECVGLATGTWMFTSGGGQETPGLAEVQRLIHEANDRVGDDTAHRTIAYVLPLPWRGDGVLGASDVVHQLYGAYAAQVQANEGDNGDGTPKIRIVVGNLGHAAASWPVVADELLARREQERITAVAGIGASLEATKRFAARLSAAGLPMVGSTITADDLNGHDFPHLYRAGPDNRDEVKVLLAYLKDLGRPPQSNYLAVADDPGDAYVRQLETAFRETVGTGFAPRPFDPHALGSTEAINSIAREVCRREGKVTVYFAARTDQVRTFLVHLAAACAEPEKVTVLTGDDATDLIDSTDPALRQALTSRIFTLVMTGLAHPDAWKTKPPALATLQSWINDRTDNRGIDYRDGSAMMAYDAVSITVRAIRSLAAGAGAGDMGSLVNGFNQITEGDPYCGASGPIAFHTEPERRGDTVNKAVPVISLGTAATADFRELRHPDGAGGVC